MPHVMIDYSPNLEPLLDMAALCDALRRAAGETGVFPMAGIRVRATACTHVSIADGAPGNGFVDISVRLRGGRSDAAKQAATQHIFAAAEAFCAAHMTRHPFMLSMEMRDIDPDLSPKASSIRRFLPEEMR
ncbi:MAG: 5-carboxymethyl-2-hydroxymuconate Delta-isomerase [Rhodobacteraceae bacterium]|nr:5-carboxymethyl-2-hydroxymuconate Delta-isomerase [Paracoccaceae bacterium]